MYYTEVTKLVL